MNWPRITVVTPTYNRVEFLEECIQSVLSQNYPNLEFIICDGGSKNEALFELIRKYEDKLAWWDSVPDKGHAEAIRRGFDNSTGEILAYLCSDDCYLSGALFAIAKSFTQNPDADVFFGNTVTLGNDGIVVSEKHCFPYNRFALFTTLPWCQPSMFWTRKIYNKAGAHFGGFNWEFVVYEPNVDIVARFYNAGAKFQFIKKLLSVDRRHDGTVTAIQNGAVRKYSWNEIRNVQPFLTHPFVYPILFNIMRVYQVFALVMIGDGKFALQSIKNKFRK